MSKPIALLAAAVFALATAATACSTSDDDGGAAGNGGGGTGGTGGTGGSGGGGNGSTCETTAECRSGTICNPDTSTCTAEPVACTDHGACGAAAFCSEEGTCERNATGGPCDADANCKPGESCTGGFCGCEGEAFVAEQVAPNVLILLDRSGSMRDEVGGTAKWDIAASAIDQLLDTYGDEIRFGLGLYPLGRNSCSPGDVVVDIDDGTAQAIRDELASRSPGGNTPIGGSLEMAADYTPLADASRENYVLLLTDGEETCDGDGVGAVEALRGQDPEVKTFVVGFGGEVDAGLLNQMAVAAGTELPGETKYYQADDAASLAAAFADIGGAVLSCTYQLSSTGRPLQPSDIFVYFDGVAVPYDATGSQGWSYDAETRQVTFFGSDCEALRTGSVADLVIVHGCPVIIG